MMRQGGADEHMGWAGFRGGRGRTGRITRRVTGRTRCFALGALLLAAQAPAAELWERLPAPKPLPVPAVSGYAPVNGVQIYYAEFGRGEPVILLHGGLGNMEQFGNQIPMLTSHFEVVALDSRGHGRSTRSAVPFSYHLMASDVLGLMDYLKIQRAAIVGWSDGGITGLDLAVYHPDRVNKLIAIAANYSVSGYRQDKAHSETLTKYFRQTRTDYQRLSSTPNDYDSFLAAMRAMWRSQPEYSAGQLASIRVPTLIILGEHDEVVQRSQAESLARLIPGAELAIIPASSHFVMFQQPDALNQRILQFLIK